jgi:hypothetical protein
MEKRSLVLALALTVPLLIYGIPYAYAATTSTQSTYTVTKQMTMAGNTLNSLVHLQCLNPADYTDHYTTYPNNPTDVHTRGSYLLTSTGATAGTGDNPNGWIIDMINSYPNDLDATVQIVCQSPVTVSVAGIGVPEFGSLYVAIALGAVIYFALSRQQAGRRAAPAQVRA